MRGRSGRVTQRYHNSPHWKQGYGVRVTSRTGRARGIWGDFEKVSELRWDLPQGKTVGFRLLAETFVAGATRVRVGCRWKSQNRKIVPLSPYVEEPLNSKVIKSFVPEQRSRRVFFTFQDPMFYVIYVIYIYEHYMSISHMAVSGYGTVIVMGPLPTHWWTLRNPILIESQVLSSLG